MGLYKNRLQFFTAFFGRREKQRSLDLKATYTQHSTSLPEQVAPSVPSQTSSREESNEEANARLQEIDSMRIHLRESCRKRDRTPVSR